MNVVHLSWTDINGGAARAAWRVHRSLDSVGIHSSMFVGSRETHGSDVTQYSPSRGPVSRVRRAARRAMMRRDQMKRSGRVHRGFDPYWEDRTADGPEVGELAPAADIYHIHQITGFLDYGSSRGWRSGLQWCGRCTR